MLKRINFLFFQKSSYLDVLSFWKLSIKINFNPNIPEPDKKVQVDGEK